MILAVTDRSGPQARLLNRSDACRLRQLYALNIYITIVCRGEDTLQTVAAVRACVQRSTLSEAADRTDIS